ncbi:MAG: ferredoxin-type protein [Ignavibacteria bacterium]|nr:MAG: ferredoxin-type protein [Ignavibacteria bacterium]KAF0161032.1 MAG: ferredoxin-type protein [Ignavibacteria bacterium]
MNTSLLRKIRIVVSIVFFIAATFLFIDIFHFVTPEISNKIVFLQFVPSLLKFAAVLSFTAFGFIIIIVLTILFGRVYCSSICPLGTFQDVINNIAGRIRKKKKRRAEYLKEYKVLRFFLLALPLVVFILGSALAVSFLDPYSIYGRFAGSFFRPVLAFVNNIAASILESANLYWVYPFDLKAFHLIPFAITFVFSALVVVMAWKKGRLYCNTICPVGTLLGYLSKISLFRVVIKEEDCLSCGACARECKSNCIDSNNKTIDVTRCVNCFNCLTSCPTEGISYSFSFKKKEGNGEVTNKSKRDFLTKASLYLLSLSSIGAQVEKKIKAKKPSTVPVFRKVALSPPGSENIARFNAKCTACHLCVSACPTQVLQPSFLEYGFTGMLQPRLDAIASFCNFECKVCGDVCPTGAILPLELEKKKLVQIGKAIFVEDNCIVKTEKTDCGACSEHCPTKAVHMIPYEGKLFIPEVRDKFCIGCGACEYACPVAPYKSIYIEGNSIHILAEKNTEFKEQQKVDLKEEFPF